MERFWIDFGIDITGWFGSGCVLAAYGMLSLHRVTARSKLYQALNILGSLCLIVNTVFYSAYPSAFCEYAQHPADSLALNCYICIDKYLLPKTK